MSDKSDEFYIDLTPEKCISIKWRHILLKHKDGSYYQGRPINPIENVLTDEIIRLRADLAQLRADLQAAQERIAWLTTDIGESGLAAINRLIAACNRMDIPQQYTPDLSIARDEILRQARKLDEARTILQFIGKHDYPNGTLRNAASNWLAANPAPSPDEQRCTCGMGDATMPEYHTSFCALKVEHTP